MTIRPAFAAFRRAMVRWDVALAVCCIIATLGLIVLSTGCQMPTEPEPAYRTSCEAGCTETVAVPLDAAETKAWMQRARDEVQAMADAGAIRLSQPLANIADPRVEWRPCPWGCRDCYNAPGGNSTPDFNHCIAGTTDAERKVIYVSTWQRDRRGPLVQWEARNYFWIRTGNGNLAY